MSGIRKTITAGLVAMSMGLVAVPVLAGAFHGGKPDAEQFERMEKKRTARHQAMHDKLKITAAQEPAWKTYLDKTRPVRPAHGARADGAKKQELTSVERLERRAAHLDKMQQRTAEQLAATKALYAVLDDEQKQVFDKLQERKGKRHGKGHRHERG